MEDSTFSKRHANASPQGPSADATPDPATDSAPSWWSPFAHLNFAVIWAASTAGLIGVAMSDTASGWLMTSLNADPTAVSMVQVATNLPMFLFTLLAGALADIFDSRRFLLVVESGIAIFTLAFAGMVSMGSHHRHFAADANVRAERGLDNGGSRLALDHAAARAKRGS